MIGLRSFFAFCVAAVLAGAVHALAAPPAPEITVYKSATCGCCSKWVEHLKANGFKVTAHDVQSLDSVKRNYGVPQRLGSCHTAVIDGYVIEGHVPADSIKRLLAERPKVKGLAVPGMPIGSPGMEQGSQRQPYEVVAFREDGATRVYERR